MNERSTFKVLWAATNCRVHSDREAQILGGIVRTFLSPTRGFNPALVANHCREVAIDLGLKDDLYMDLPTEEEIRTVASKFRPLFYNEGP